MCIRDRGYGAQQTQGHQLQHRFFSRRKGRKFCILEISGRDYCVVFGYFLIVDDRLRITGNGDPFAKRHSIGNQIDHSLPVIEFQPDTAVFYSSKIHILLIKKGV